MSSTPLVPDLSTYTPLDGETDEQKKARALQQSVSFAAQQNPDEYAKRLALQKQTGISPDVSQGNEADVKHAADVHSLDYPALAVSHPRTTAWASNPDNAAVSGVDEIQRLTGMESRAASIRAMPSFGDRLKSNYKNGDFSFIPGLQTVKALVKTVTETPEVRNLPINYGKTLGQGMDDARFLYEGVNKPLDTSLLQPVASGVDFLANNRPEVTKGVIPDAIWNVIAGVSKGEARSAAGLATPKNLAILLSSGNLPVNAKALLDTYFASEMIPGVAETPKRIMDSPNAQEKIAAGFEGLVNAIFTKGVVSGIGTTHPFYENMAHIVTSAEESKLRTRSPEKFHEAMQQMFDGHDSLRIPAEEFDTYFQSKNIDPAQVAQQLGAKNYLEAKAAGTAIEIAPADFIGKLDPEHQQGLLGDVVNPADGLTFNQRTQGEQELQKFVAEGGMEKVLADAQKVDAETQASPEYQDIKTQLRQQYIDAGETPEIADNYATLQANVYSNLARETGMKPAELMGLYAPKMTSGEAPGMEGLHQSQQSVDEFMASLGEPADIQLVNDSSNNASGESSASIEAQNRLAAEKAAGVERIRIDTRSGQRTPLIGVDAADAKAGPYDRIIAKKADGSYVTLDEGAKARPTFYQPAYHGSPYKFDKFSLEHMGKGEGAQAYGYGLYFAGNKEVADFYRKNLTHGSNYSGDYAYLAAVKDFKANGYSEADAATGLREAYKDAPEKELQAALADVYRRDEAGQLYEVNIPEDDTMLHWDKPLSEQPEKVRKALAAGLKQKANGPEERGSDGMRIPWKSFFDDMKDNASDTSVREMYQMLTSPEVIGLTPEEASKFLNSHGISGIKYLDGSSRSKGEGNHNYVIFDDQAINILKTYYQGDKDPKFTRDGGNKLVTSSGNPKVFYHGTTAGVQIEDFRSSKSGMLGPGIYVTDHPGYASQYTDTSRSVGISHDPIKGGSVFPVHVRMENPYTIVQNRDGRTNWNRALNHFNVDDRAQLWQAIRDAGHDGIIFKGDVDHNEYVVFSPDQIKSAIAPKYQGGDSPRGWFRVLPDGSFEIGKTKIGDLSTFVHEPAHSYLFLISDLAKREGASENLKGDYQKILEFLGAKDGEALTTEQHEKWARANEQYLREGKAPSASLKGVFQRFAVWLSSIYKRASDLGVELSDDIRGVMDRIYAAEDGVNRAAKESGPRTFSSPEEIGWTPEQFQAYADSKGLEVEQAKAEIVSKLNEAAVRDRTDAWREEEKNTREAVTQEIDSRPEYTALRSLKKGKLDDGTPLTLNRDELIKQFGQERVDAINKQHIGIYRAEGGVDAEAAAEILGFNSGEEMLHTLENVPRRTLAIEQATREFMTAKHGDIRYDGTLDDRARLALENDKKAANLHKELKGLQKKLAEMQGAAKDQKAAARAIQTPPIEAFRTAAETIVAEKPLMDMQPSRYLDASRVASREAFDAMRKGDIEAATAAKQKELLNHFLFREASKVKAEAEKIFTSVGKYKSKAVREKIAQAGAEQGQHVYLDQIDNILEQFRFSKETNKDIRLKFEQFAALKQAEAMAQFFDLNPNWAAEHPGETPEIPQIVDTSIAGMSKNYRELTINELRAVRDALKNVETLARREWGILRDGKVVSFAQEVADFERVSRENNNSKTVPRSGTKLGVKESVIDSVHGLDAAMQKMEWFVDRLDGGDINGPARRNIKQPIDDAWGESLRMGDEVFTKLKELVGARTKEDVKALDESTGIQFPKSDRPLNRRQLISWALNLGTAENQKVALIGEGLLNLDGSPSPLVDQALRTLRSSELKFIQGVWDILEGMRPAIEAKALRTTGIAPKMKKVTPFDVTSAEGEVVHMRGGYYPLKGEPGDRVGQKQLDPAQMFSVGSMKPKTSTSHLQQVTGATYRLLLDYENVLSKHLADVISDTTKSEAIGQVYKFLSEDRVRSTVQETLGAAESKEFMEWLRDFAGNNRSGVGDNLPLVQWLLNRRSGMVVARLGGNLSSYLIQMGDVFKSIADPDIKTKYVAKAFLDIRRNPTQLIEEIRALSPNEMAHREKNFNRDIRDMLESKSPFDQKKQIVTEFLMDGFAVMDRMVTFPAWLGRFRQGMEEHGDQARAVKEADRAIARDYMAGDNRNMSRMMRAGGLTRLLTTFQGDANTWYGLISSSIRSGNPRAISVGIMALVAEQVVGQYIRNRGPKDDQNYAGWGIEQILLAGLNLFPVAGDVGQYGLSKLTGQYATLQNPTMQALEKTGAAPGSIYAYTQGKKDLEEMMMDLTEATGIYAGIPGTSQAIRTWKYIHNVRTGKEPEPKNAYEAARGAAQGSNKKH